MTSSAVSSAMLPEKSTPPSRNLLRYSMKPLDRYRSICFRHSRRVARDNTVKYRWRTLQLLPGRERRSYAGAVVDVLEDLDGQMAVRYRGEIIASQEAPSRPGILRTSPALPRTNRAHVRTSTVWAGAGRRSWQHSTQRWTPAMLTTTAPSESARRLP